MATYGETPSWTTYSYYEIGNQNQVCTPLLSMPQHGIVTAIVFFANSQPGYSPTNFYGCVWNSGGGLITNSGAVSVGAGSDSVGGQSWITAGVNRWIKGGTSIYIGWTRDNSNGHSMLFSTGSGTGYIAQGGNPGSLGSLAAIGMPGAYIVYNPVSNPTATTNAATGISATAATISGTFYDGGLNAAGGGPSNYYLYYGTSPTGPWTQATTGTFTGTATQSFGLTGLTAATTYYFYAYDGLGVDGTVNATGSVLSFTTVGTPNAPTLTAPANNSATNLASSGATFSWTYNTGGAAGGQTAYAFKFTSPLVNGGAAQWWTGSAWATTETFVSSATGSITIAGSNFTGTAGSTCTWTVANKDANGTGPYAANFTLISEGPPNAPTLTAPANNAYSDLSGTPTFSWTYNASNGVGGQTAYAFREKLSGGAYSYWNASSVAWQSTVVWNTATATSLTFPTGKWSNGNTYNWSVATQDAGGQGVFAADFTLTGQAAPTVTVTAPSGTVQQTSPPVTWTETLGGGVQTFYQVKTFSAAQYGAAGFNPATSTATDDSGAVASSALSYQMSTILVAGTSYRAYVNVTQTGGQTNNWNAYSAFTSALDLPPAPTFTATATTDPTTGCPMIQLTATAALNLLSAADASIESGIGTWTATNAALAQSNTHAIDGSYALKVTPSAAGATTVVTGLYQCLPNTSYVGMLSSYAGLSADSITAHFSWYTAASVLISSVAGTPVTDSTSAWTQATVTATAPANAYYMTLWLSFTAGGTTDTRWLDENGIFPATSVPTWSAGWSANSANLIITRSDGLYVRNASSGSPAVIPYPGTQTVTVNDYEAVPGTAYAYTAVLQTTGFNGLVQSAAATAGASLQTGQKFWTLDPTTPSTASAAQPISWNPQSFEQSAAHVVLGQATTNVVASAMQAQDFSATFEVFTIADYQSLFSLVIGQKTVYVSDPYGFGYYLRLALAPGMGGGGSSKAHDTQLQPSTAAGPHRLVAVTGVAQPRPAV